MSTLRRNTSQTTLGVEIQDTQMNYVVLAPTSDRQESRLESWGSQTIAFDAVEEGRILQVSQVSQAISKMQQATKASKLVFITFGNTALDEEWRELFAIGGFSTVEAVPLAPAFDKLLIDLGETSLPVLYFARQDQAVLYHRGVEVDSYEYPFSVQAVFELQDYISAHEGEPLRLCGYMEAAPREMARVIDEYAIAAEPARLWRNCFDTSEIIPSLPHEEAYEYSAAIACAYYGVWFYFHVGGEEQSQPVEAPRQVLDEQDHSAQASSTPKEQEAKKTPSSETSLKQQFEGQTEQSLESQQANKHSSTQAETQRESKESVENPAPLAEQKRATKLAESQITKRAKQAATKDDTKKQKQQTSQDHNKQTTSDKKSKGKAGKTSMQRITKMLPRPKLKLPRMPKLWLEDADEVLKRVVAKQTKKNTASSKHKKDKTQSSEQTKNKNK